MADGKTGSLSAPSSSSSNGTQIKRLFSLPTIMDNPNGWGPTTIPSQFRDIPFAPFNKSDRLGRVSDWTVKFQKGEGRGYRGNNPNSMSNISNSSVFGYKHDEDESSFSVVNETRVKQKKFGFGQQKKQYNNQSNQNNKRNFNQQRGNMGNSVQGRGGSANVRGRSTVRGRGGRKYANFNDQEVIKEPSYDIPEDWKVLQEIEISQLSKISLTVPDPEDLVLAGTLEAYNNEFDRITPRLYKTLQKYETRHHITTTASSDPILTRLAKQKAGNVYATDTILALIMACPRSVHSWDIIVRKDADGQIFLDKRPDSGIDLLSVNENWNEVNIADTDNLNHPTNLSNEATAINYNFSQQVLTKSESSSSSSSSASPSSSTSSPSPSSSSSPQIEPNPFNDFVPKGTVPASVAYRYRKFNLGEHLKVVARCELNAYAIRKTKRLNLLIKALNEFDSKLSGNVDWRQKLESQTAAVLTAEMKNNANKLARWTAQAILSGADEMRIGFVSRVHPKDCLHHVILTTQRYPPKSFATSLNISVNNMFGTLRLFLDMCRQLEEGQYLILKDPQKSQLRVYRTPKDAFANESGVIFKQPSEFKERSNDKPAS